MVNFGKLVKNGTLFYVKYVINGTVTSLGYIHIYSALKFFADASIRMDVTNRVEQSFEFNQNFEIFFTKF